MNYKRLLSLTRQAVDDYHMIQSGDKIALAISGGKDSLAMATALKGLSRFYQESFSVQAYTVDLGFGMDYSPLQAFFKEWDIPYTIIQTQISEIVFEARQEENPCSLCAKMRKGALYKQAVLDGCNKAALGHHREDVTTTLFLSLLYEGSISTFPPVTYLDRTGITVIRPLIYCPEKEIVAYTRKEGFPVVKNACPADGRTSRQSVEDLLRGLEEKDHELAKRLFTAIQNSDLPGWRLEK